MTVGILCKYFHASRKWLILLFISCFSFFFFFLTRTEKQEMECLNFNMWWSCFSLNKNAFCIRFTFDVFPLTAKLIRNITDLIFTI